MNTGEDAMKTAALTLALLLGGAAFAQTDSTTAYDGDGLATTAFETDATFAAADAMAGDLPAAAGALVQPSNANPERDARGIAVLSDPAIVPAGWNGTAGVATAMGGPELDPVTGEPVAEAESYPACTATVTDNCLQTYERQSR
jgi:hypothetical protein